MQLRRFVNCLKLLNWETQLPDGCPADQWLARLRRRGGEPLYQGHEELLVTRTGRVTSSVAYTTPHAERKLAAERVFAGLRVV